jgi:16S rRNA (guanine527-N7)-methyltransferase
VTRGGRGSRAPQNRALPPPSDAPKLRLTTGARRILGRELTSAEQASFDIYMGLLAAWQRVYRLVGSADPGWVVDELILDSLLFTPFLPRTATRVLDLGSGAGIPGIPLKIVSPALRFTLLDARRRRASFLATVVRELGLADTEVLSLRAEEALARRPEARAGFDVVVTRCAGRLASVARSAALFLAPGGRLIASGPPDPGLVNGPGEWVTVRHPCKERPRTLFVLDSQ